MLDNVKFLEIEEEEDLREIFFRFRDAVNGPHDEAYFQWLLSYPHGPLKGLVALSSGNEIIGGITVTIWKGCRYGKKFKIALANFEFVEKAFQKKGLGPLLFSESVDLASRYGADLRLGYPNVNSKRMKIDKWIVCDLPRYTRVLDPLPYLKRRISNDRVCKFLSPMIEKAYSFFYDKRFEDNIYLKEINRFDNSIEELWDKVASRFAVAIYRDANFLNWRYSDFPDKSYRILSANIDKSLVGYIVYRIVGNSIHIYDMLFDVENPIPDMFISYIGRYFKGRGFINLEMKLFSKKVMEPFLVRNGFIKRGEENIGFLTVNEEFSEFFKENVDLVYFSVGDNNSVFFNSLKPETGL